MLMVHEKHPKIGAAGSENGFVCLEVNVIDCNATVTEKAPLSLVVELLQDVAAVAGLRHLPSVEDLGNAETPRSDRTSEKHLEQLLLRLCDLCDFCCYYQV